MAISIHSLLSRLAAGAFLLLGAAMPAAQACPIQPVTVYVGDTVNDHACNYATIKAAIDAQTCPVTIMITDELSHVGEIINIENKSLSLVGAVPGAHCGQQINPNAAAPQSTATARVKLDPTGTFFPVVAISGNSNVTISNLELSNANSDGAFGFGGGVSFSGTGNLRLNSLEIHNNAGLEGGGVYFTGAGSLTLDGVSIHNNTGGNGGGGISVDAADGGSVAVTILDDAQQPTSIHANTTTGLGAGIHLRGNAYLSAIAHAANRVDISLNTTTSEGGGMMVEDGASADLGLPGMLTTGIHDNTARYGGGIYNEGMVRLFSTVANAPMVLANNTATGYGGGLLNWTGSTACLYGVGMSGNSGQSSAALAVIGSVAFIDEFDAGLCSQATIVALGAVQCDAATAGCNEYSDNVAGPFGGYSGNGAVVEMSMSGALHAARLRLRDNSAGSAFYNAIADGFQLQLENCAVTDNHFELIAWFSIYTGSTAQSSTSFDGCTIANNHIPPGDDAFYVFSSQAGLALRNSIIAEPGTVTLIGGMAEQVSADYVLSNDITSLPASSTVISADPLFVDAATGDYHLRVGSPALDFAPAGAGQDIERQPRSVDLPGSPNQFGPRDLGAFEYQIGNVHDRIFLDAFDGP